MAPLLLSPSLSAALSLPFGRLVSSASTTTSSRDPRCTDAEASFPATAESSARWGGWGEHGLRRDKAAPKQRIQESIPPHPGSRGSDGAGTEACFSGGGPCRKSVTAAALDSICRRERRKERRETERGNRRGRCGSGRESVTGRSAAGSSTFTLRWSRGAPVQAVIDKERRGDYLGKTIQVVPHITDEIQDWIERVAIKP